jgi:S-adenosylmethionine hydrolase
MNIHESGQLSSWPDFVDNFFMPIALLTDFGARDYFVASMKGVILSIDPAAVIVDITHDVPPQDISEAAFALRACYRDFPAGTIFVAVVDPGVGSDRRAILAEAGGRYFIAPDNGLLSFILDNEAAARVFQISNPEFSAAHIGGTFHGRDIFAPAAAHLSRGADPVQFGPLISDPQRLPATRPERISAMEIEGRIIHIDRFGNIITNLTSDDLPAKFIIEIGDTIIETHRKFYAEAREGEVFSIMGSASFLEISVRNGSAKDILGAEKGDKILVKM